MRGIKSRIQPKQPIRDFSINCSPPSNFLPAGPLALRWLQEKEVPKGPGVGNAVGVWQRAVFSLKKTQTSCIITEKNRKSLKITIHLHVLNPPQRLSSQKWFFKNKNSKETSFTLPVSGSVSQTTPKIAWSPHSAVTQRGGRSNGIIRVLPSSGTLKRSIKLCQSWDHSFVEDDDYLCLTFPKRPWFL